MTETSNFHKRAVSLIKNYIAANKDTLILKQYKEIAAELHINKVTLRTYLKCYALELERKKPKHED